MTSYVSTTPGLFPLPDWAKDDLSDLKGHQRGDLVSGDDPAPIREVYDEARAEVVDRQADAGLDRVVEGQLRWDDMLAHPLAVHDAVETRGLVRYYDNNNFYREPVVTGPLEADGDVADELAAVVDGGTADPVQAVLPGPYSLFDLATDAHYGDDREFLSAVGRFLAGEVEAFPDVETLFLLEPSLVVDPPGSALGEAVSEAVDEVAAAADAEVVVHTYWDAFEEATYAHLLDAGIDGVGFDLISAPEANAEVAAEFGTPDSVAVGVVDGGNTLVESPETIRERVEWFEERLPGAVDLETVYVTANTELFYLPVNRFEEKLDALGAATTPEVTA